MDHGSLSLADREDMNCSPPDAEANTDHRGLM
jgi:hypothetical protein